MSHRSTKLPPKRHVSTKEFFKLSPLVMLTKLGIISPKKGIFPTITKVSADTADTKIKPIFTTLA